MLDYYPAPEPAEEPVEPMIVEVCRTILHISPPRRRDAFCALVLARGRVSDAARMLGRTRQDVWAHRRHLYDDPATAELMVRLFGREGRR